MGKFLEISGWLLLVGTVALIFASTGPGNSFAFLGSLIWGVPMMFGSLLLAVLGKILSELVALRATNDELLAALRNINPKTDPGSLL
jgi:hypothetical protein